MQRQELSKNLSDSPGVYFFRSGKQKSSKPIYIGKATSLRDRVRSYFNIDLGKARGPAIVKMLKEAKSVDVLKTDSVLEALLLEMNLINKNQPKYNVRSRDDKSFNHVAITMESYPRVLLIRRTELESSKIKYKYIFGPFIRSNDLKIALKLIRKIFPYRDKCIPAGEAGEISKKKSCFNAQIGLCPGVCTGLVSEAEYAFSINNLKLFFEGKKKEIVKNLKSQMLKYAKTKEFEKAKKIRNQIFAIGHIQDIALLKKEQPIPGRKNFRIEAYDIAHISGLSVVGGMAVWEGGILKKEDYRLFRIRGGDRNNDVANLKQVLERRIQHDEWSYPDIVVVDGGKAQINIANKVLKSSGLSIPVIGIVKDEKHKAKEIKGLLKIFQTYKDAILQSNEEAHRFSLSYHKKVRGRAFV